ncbi:hypothetical protein [Limosilactobacillus agrestimuris]|uniref:hypothetical protein n=1 Tax=Limosilactobacillus agrestimuris TaxID=2941331 RepID=UPI00203DC6D6|nr:hypothetical protein [Limosilactobacillus agrestimuris]
MDSHYDVENIKIYNYLDEETKDVVSYIKGNLDLSTLIKLSNHDRDALISSITELLDAEDSITGNGSGSYSCNELKAERCLYGNWKLIQEAITTICPDSNVTDCSPEQLDVLVRVYVLEKAVDKALHILMND